MLPRKLRVVGCDPSLRNWGLAVGEYDTTTHKLTIESLETVNPVLPTGKQTRQNSLDLASAHQLHFATQKQCLGAHAIFVEIPVGSQSARAMASYGICVGIWGSFRSSGTSFFEVTPNEVKLAGPGKKTATKAEMIDWATRAHPEANWPRYKSSGVKLISEAKAEHMADAVAAIYAGIRSQPFQQLLPLMAA